MQLIYKTELIPFEWYCTVNDPQPKKKFQFRYILKKNKSYSPLHYNVITNVNDLNTDEVKHGNMKIDVVYI